MEFELFIKGLREKYKEYDKRFLSDYYDYGDREDYIRDQIKCDLLGDILEIAVEALNSCKPVEEGLNEEN